MDYTRRKAHAVRLAIGRVGLLALGFAGAAMMGEAWRSAAMDAGRFRLQLIIKIYKAYSNFYILS